MEKKIILFDFDGVIADSFQAAYAVSQMICPHVDETTYRKLFEGNIHDRKDSIIGEHTAECRLDMDFTEHYAPKMKNEVQIFLDMQDVIAKTSAVYNLVIISSTMTTVVLSFLEARNLQHHFAWIMGSDVHKSKEVKIKMVFEKYNVDSSSCLFVTDTLGDIQEARNTGVDSIAVTWGYNTSETLEKGSPFRLVETPTALQAAISDYFAQ